MIEASQLRVSGGRTHDCYRSISGHQTHLLFLWHGIFKISDNLHHQRETGRKKGLASGSLMRFCLAATLPAC